MVPEHARYNQQHGAHYLSSVLSLGTSLGLVMMDPVCVWERCFRRSVDGLQEMELGNQWEEQWLIQYLSSQGLKQHYYTLPTSHTRSYLQGFCLPSAFTDLHCWKRKLFIHDPIHRRFTPSPASLTDWNTLSSLNWIGKTGNCGKCGTAELRVKNTAIEDALCFHESLFMLFRSQSVVRLVTY